MTKPNTTLILALTVLLLIPTLCLAGIEFDGVDDYICCAREDMVYFR